MIDTNYQHAKGILEREVERIMAEALITETIDEDRSRDIVMRGREPKPPSDWEDRDTPSPGSRARAVDGRRRRQARSQRDKAPYRPAAGGCCQPQLLRRRGFAARARSI